MGDHLNSGIRNIVVRGPGLNCRLCSSVMGIPRNPKSTRKSRSCWVTDRPCIAYINKRFKNDVNFMQCVFESNTESEKGQEKTMWQYPSVNKLLQIKLISVEGLWLASFSATHQAFTLSSSLEAGKTKRSPFKVSDKTLYATIMFWANNTIFFEDLTENMFFV